MPKFISAQALLDEKGFRLPPFDTTTFQESVAAYFKSSDVAAKLEIVAVRFVEYQNTPSAGFSAAEARNLYYKYYDKVWDSDKLEFVNVGEEKLEINKYYLIPDFLQQTLKAEVEDVNDRGYLRKAAIFVDEPYAKNALGLLKMGGFVISRRHKFQNKFPSYTVTLV